MYFIRSKKINILKINVKNSEELVKMLRGWGLRSKFPRHVTYYLLKTVWVETFSELFQFFYSKKIKNKIKIPEQKIHFYRKQKKTHIIVIKQQLLCFQ